LQYRFLVRADEFSSARSFMEFDTFTHDTGFGYTMLKIGQKKDAAVSSKLPGHLSQVIQDLHYQGLAALSRGNASDAEIFLRRARDLAPDNPAILNDHGIALAQLGKVCESLDIFRRAVRLAPQFYQAYCNLGKLLIDKTCYREAEEALSTALALQPDYPETLNTFAWLRRNQYRIVEAISFAKRAVTLQPDYYVGWYHLGAFLSMSGDVEGALDAYTRALTVDPARYDAQSNIFMLMNYLEGVTQEDLYRESAAWGNKLKVSILSPPANHDKLLRIGMVSADFRNHSVGAFLVAVFEYLDCNRFQIYCYNNSTTTDYVTELFKESAVTWRDIAGLSDEQVSGIIGIDEIQILVDLSGHTAGNRLALFALRPAPVQVTWLGYFNTTGHPAMDWIIMDQWSIRPNEEQWFTEKVYRLPETRFCYTPPMYAPNVSATPSRRLGFVTFGCFNNFMKYTTGVIRTWATILCRIPNARLVLKDESFGNPEYVHLFQQRFKDVGGEIDRIEFRGKSSHREMLLEYGDLDIVLDPFPFNGGLTTCEALWMGVPVVTMSGVTPVSRQGLTFLSLLGLTDLIVQDTSSYIDIAVNLAGDVDRLESLRMTMRDKMAASPLCDGVRYSRNLENAFELIWEEYVQSIEEYDRTYFVKETNCALVPALKAPISVSVREVPTEEVIHQEEWADPHELVGLAKGFMQSGMNQEALVYLEKARPLLPKSSELFRMLGTVQAAVGLMAEAEWSLERAVDLAPGDAVTYRLLGSVMQLQQKIDDAEAYFRLSLGIHDLSETRQLLVKLYHDVNRLSEAKSEVLALLEKEPDNIDALCELGEILLACTRYSEAEVIFRRSVEIDTLSAKTQYSLGKCLAFIGELRDALGLFRRALDRDPGSSQAHSAILFLMNYIPEVTSDEILLEGQQWWRRHGAPRLRSAPPLELHSFDPERKLRIGYVSPDLARHPVGFFLAGVLPSHDRQRFEVFCYSDLTMVDDLTEHLQQHSDHWLATAGYSDEALFRIIRKDRIDILVDLSGHCGRNRLTLFAMRPAPIQATWAGYVGTTGLQTMDYLISDRQESPEWADDQACEEIIRLPDAFICWHPPPHSPDPTALPAMISRRVTFGCFNSVVKINSEVVSLWARILQQLPDSIILLKTREFASTDIRNRIAGLFSENGISLHRLVMEEGSNQLGMLEAYSRVDIALDPFPYTGGTTTIEALWMGVPVVTKPGKRFCSRHSLSYLSTICLTSCVATSDDDYVAIALRLAGDLGELSSVRSGLRARMLNSPLLDAVKFTKNLEDAFGTMWRATCGVQPSVPAFEIPDDKTEKPAPSIKHSEQVDLDLRFDEANSFFIRKELGGASAIYHSILLEYPNNPRALRAIGVIAHLRGESQKSIELLSQAIELKPDFIDAYLDLGKVLFKESRYGDVENVIRKFIELDQSNQFAYNLLANVCLMTLRHEEARKLFRHSLSLAYSTNVQSNLLMDLEYDDTFSDEEVFQEHQRWGERFGAPLDSTIGFPARKPFSEKVLRIGYLSGDFSRHPVGFVLDQVLPFHNKAQFRIYCFATKTDNEDDLTEKFRTSSDCWRDISKLEDIAVAELIRKDRIDILVDLSGHTGGQRLHALTYRPAPIQISWLGYWNTTGLKCMDYVIYDKVTLTPVYEHYFVENVLFLPHSRFCFTPPWIAPEPGASPCIAKGVVTFGCFATTAKMTPDVINCWAQILKQLPDSRLVLKCRSYSDCGTIVRFRESFESCGICTNRIDFRGVSTHLELFDEYRSIDIALDPFPFSGAATSFDALWMGVPVVTLAGRRPSGRQTLSFLKVLGLEELVAGTVDEYIDIAVNLARDRSKLAKLRTELRPRLASSPLCDGKRFTAELEKLYRQVWAEWCKNADNEIDDHGTSC
jgi:predicted O-linked N-acetylglucosamine transferase (SPINDLY family)